MALASNSAAPDFIPAALTEILLFLYESENIWLDLFLAEHSSYLIKTSSYYFALEINSLNMSYWDNG